MTGCIEYIAFQVSMCHHPNEMYSCGIIKVFLALRLEPEEGGEEEGRSCLRARAGAGKGWVEVTLRISQRQIM